MKIPNI